MVSSRLAFKVPPLPVWSNQERCQIHEIHHQDDGGVYITPRAHPHRIRGWRRGLPNSDNVPLGEGRGTKKAAKC